MAKCSETVLLLLWVTASGHLLQDSESENHETETRTPMTILRPLNASALANLEHQATLDAAAGLSNVSLSDLEKDNSTLQLQLRYRARKKQERLLLIQAQIIRGLRVSPWRHSNHSANSQFTVEERQRMQHIFERMHQIHQARQSTTDDSVEDQQPERNNNVYAERFQSFYPACTPPNHTERSLWGKAGTLRLNYPITFPQRAPHSPTETTILSAKLRLHKHAGPSPQDEANCLDCPSPPASYPAFLLSSPLTITVSVYHFVKPLRQHRREKKRLVDSRVVPTNFEGWLEFNIVPSLHQWFQSRHRNYGLDIEVDDVSGNKLDPNRYFRNVNCSDPNDMAENESSVFDNETYPTLDLQTAEYSRHPIPQQHLNEQETGQQMVSSDQQRFFRKRHAGYVPLTKTWNQKCRRETLYVSFYDLGLDGLIVEPGLRVSYCTSTTKHGTNVIGQEERHERVPDCCVARSHRPLHVHYLAEDGEVHRVTLNNLSARHCHCPVS